MTINNGNLVSTGVLGTAGVNQMSGGLTPEVLNNLVFLGVTFGAWVTIILALGALMVLIYNFINIVDKIHALQDKRERSRRKQLKQPIKEKQNHTQ